MDGLVASSLAIHALMDESTQIVTMMASVVSAAAQEMLREMMEHQLAFIKIPVSIIYISSCAYNYNMLSSIVLYTIDC